MCVSKDREDSPLVVNTMTLTRVVSLNGKEGIKERIYKQLNVFNCSVKRLFCVVPMPYI